MCKCIECFYFDELLMLDDLDLEAAVDGYIGYCNLDGLYIPPDYICDNFAEGV